MTCQLMTKVFLDTNIIVSASIQVNSQKFGKPVIHPFFQESMHLLSTIRKKPNKQFGISSKTVEGETYRVIIKAVKHEVDKQIIQQSNISIETLFDEFSRISNVCLNKTRQLLSFISIEPVDSSEVQKNLGLVEEMAKSLKITYEGKYINRINKEIAAKRRRDTTMKFQWKTELRREVYRMFREEIEREAIQICGFMSNEPHKNKNDKQILAEAITIKNTLDNSQFYIASNDKKFFSPITLKGGFKSDLVTKEIYNRFGIICDTPKEIRTKI